MKTLKDYNLIICEKPDVVIGTPYELCLMLDDEIEYYISIATEKHICNDIKLKAHLLDMISNAYEDKKQIKERFKGHKLIKYSLNDDWTTDFEIVGKY